MPPPALHEHLGSFTPSLGGEAFAALTEAAAAIHSTLDPDAVLDTIARLACRVTHGEASSVFILDSRHSKLIVRAASGIRREAVLGREFDIHLGIPGHVLKSEQPTLILDARRHNGFHRETDDLGSLRTLSIIAAPLISRGVPIGVIEVVNRLDGTGFREGDLRLLQVFAALATGAMQNARAHEDLQQRFEGLRKWVTASAPIVGDSPPMRELIALCDLVAPKDATVLILGETGTGKELCARHIHNNSRRRQESFVAINCAALTESLLESELFGHERGAFTGAVAQHRGWFELASGGTLFLDEISEIKPSTQAKLLRVLQEREFIRVGGTRRIACNVRILAATNRDLKQMIAEGLFREDLYYRLSVFPIHVPPLRNRLADIALLVDAFVQRSAQNLGLPKPEVPPAVLAALASYRWPGNIRELQNIIERAVLLSDGRTLQVCNLPVEFQSLPGQPVGQAESNGWGLFDQEKALIRRVLEEQHWNQSRTARVLGITRDHLRHRMKKYALQHPRQLRGRPAAS